MVMPRCGTFRYVAIVPENFSRPWVAALGEPIERSGDKLRDARLVGHSPSLKISDAGLPPETDPKAGKKGRPWVVRSQVTLTAAERKDATVSAASFHVDRDLVSALHSGDQLCISRTECGGLGVSIIRHRQLIGAVGAVTAVALGDAVSIRVPGDLIAGAEAMLRQRDPEFEFSELPIEISVGTTRKLLFGGRMELGGYEVFVEHGFFRGIPGQDECAAIALKGECPIAGANASAQLMDFADALQLVQW